MSDVEVQSAAGQAPSLTQWQRVADVFTAPSKTFEDIKRGNTSWWLPFLLFVVIGTALWYTVGSRVTWETVMENGLRMSPKQAERLESLPADQQATQKRISAAVQKYIWLCAPIAILVMDDHKKMRSPRSALAIWCARGGAALLGVQRRPCLHRDEQRNQQDDEAPRN